MKALVNKTTNEVIAIGNVSDNGVNYCKTETNNKTYYSKTNLTLIDLPVDLESTPLENLMYKSDTNSIIYKNKTKWSNKDFVLMLITASEWAALKQLAVTDPEANRLVDSIFMTAYVDLEDWATIYSINYVKSAGILTEQRANDILTGVTLV